MRQGTKSQFYQFSGQTTISKGTFCTRRILIRQLPPDNAQSIENLFMHIRINTSTGSLSSGDKVLARVGVMSSVPSYGYPDTPTRTRFLTVNKAAVSDIIDATIDLSSLLDKDAVDTTFVFLEMKNASTDVSADGNTGSIELWKLDGIYTTREIR